MGGAAFVCRTPTANRAGRRAGRRNGGGFFCASPRLSERNATRDYLDFVALSELIGREATLSALESFDRLYPQGNGQSARQQLQVQLANPLPYDLDDTDLREYKKLKPDYRDWSVVAEKCREIANALW